MMLFYLFLTFFTLLRSQPSQCSSTALGVSTISWASSDPTTSSQWIQKLFPSISEESNNMVPPNFPMPSDDNDKPFNKHGTENERFVSSLDGRYFPFPEDAASDQRDDFKGKPVDGDFTPPGDDSSTCTSTVETLQFSNSCFEMSVVQVSSFSDSELAVDTLEDTFDTKWSTISDATSSSIMYDNFLDFNVKFYTDEFDTYYDSWTTLSIDTLLLTWTLKSQRYYSLIAHIPSSQINIELIGSSPTLDGILDTDSSSITIIYSEPRTSSHTLKKILAKEKATANVDNAVYPIGVSRAVSDLEANTKYYRKVLNYHTLAKDVWYYNTEDGECTDDTCNDDYYTQYAHLQLPVGGAEISFYEKSDTYFSTVGDYTVSILETLLMSDHESLMTTPYCGMHTYMLNNYKIIGNSKMSSYGASVLNKIMKLSKSDNYLYTVYQNTGHFNMMSHTMTYNYYLFLVEPNGQSILLYFSPTDFKFKGTPKTYDTNMLCTLTCTTDETNNYINAGIIFGKTIGTWAEKLIPTYVWIILAASIVGLTATIWIAYTRCCNGCKEYKNEPIPDRYVDIQTKYGSTNGYNAIQTEDDTDDEPLLSN